MPVATVVIPALNNASTIGATLAAVRAQTIAADLVVVVVDNGSSDATQAIAKPLADELLHEHTRGTAPARNRGALRAETDIVLSLDADCRPRPDWAETHVRALTSSPDSVVATAGRLVPETPNDRWAGRAEITPAPQWHGDSLQYAVGGNHAIRTAALRELGGYPAFAAEDAAMGRLIRERGWSIAWVPDAVVEHRNAQGWRGYYAQMRKHGHYAAQLAQPPRSRALWYVGVGRSLLARTGRPLLRGDMHEAAAGALRVLGQAQGGRAYWWSSEVTRPGPNPPPR